MVQYVSGAKDLLVRAINGVGDVFDALAGLVPGDWGKAAGLVIGIAGAFGVYHFKNPGAEVQALTAFIAALSAVGLAGEQLIKAFKAK